MKYWSLGRGQLSRPAISPDLGRRLSAFSLHYRLSGFEVHFTGEIENLLAFFFSDRLIYYLRLSDFNKVVSLLNINRHSGVSLLQVTKQINFFKT